MNKAFHFGQGVWQIDGVSERVELPSVESDDPVHVIGRAHAAILWESVKIKAIPGEPIEMEATGTLPAGYVAGYPVTAEMLQQLKWHDEYRRQGKRYPLPCTQKSEAWQVRTRKKWGYKP